MIVLIERRYSAIITKDDGTESVSVMYSYPEEVAQRLLELDLPEDKILDIDPEVKSILQNTTDPDEIKIPMLSLKNKKSSTVSMLPKNMDSYGYGYAIVSGNRYLTSDGYTTDKNNKSILIFPTRSNALNHASYMTKSKYEWVPKKIATYEDGSVDLSPREKRDA